MLAPFDCATPDPMELPNRGQFQMLLWRLAFQLELYHAPFDPNFPLVCMDESSKQLVGEVHPPIPVAPGHGRIDDHEYIRNGVAEIFIKVEPLGGRRRIEITERRTRTDRTNFIKGMLDERYPDAIKVRLVIDNLNTRNVASIYQAFPPEEARRLAERLEIHDTPRMAVGSTSWRLN